MKLNRKFSLSLSIYLSIATIPIKSEMQILEELDRRVASQEEKVARRSRNAEQAREEQEQLARIEAYQRASRAGEPRAVLEDTEKSAATLEADELDKKKSIIKLGGWLLMIFKKAYLIVF